MDKTTLSLASKTVPRMEDQDEFTGDIVLCFGFLGFAMDEKITHYW